MPSDQAPTRRFRILLAALPGVIADRVSEALRREANLDVLDPVASTASLEGLVDRTRTDVLIVGTSGQDLGTLTSLLYAHPRLKLLALVDDGRESFVHELVPRYVQLGSLSAEEIVGAVRTVVASDSQWVAP